MQFHILRIVLRLLELNWAFTGKEGILKVVVEEGLESYLHEGKAGYFITDILEMSSWNQQTKTTNILVDEGEGKKVIEEM